MQPGNSKPKHHEANNRRPLTPLLSFGQLSPFDTVSDGNTCSPLHLSPPVHGEISSPPPRKEGDGYFGPNAHHRTGRKPQIRNGSRSRSPGNTSLNPLAESRDSVTESPADRCNDNEAKYALGAANVSSNKDANKLPRTLRFESYPPTGSLKTEQKANDNTIEDKPQDCGSTAIRSLRRCSETHLYSEVFDPPPLLQPMASTLNILFSLQNLGACESSSNEEVEGTTDGVSRKKSEDRRSHGVEIRGRPNSKGLADNTTNPNIPATITLRKPSEVCQSEPKTGTNKVAIMAGMVQENDPAFRATVYAMAFQSRPFDPRWFPSFEDPKARRVSIPRDSSTGPGAAKQRAKSVAGLSGTLGVWRQSLLAETTLTLDEGHPHRSNCTIGPSRRRQSVSAAETLRRLSAIRAGPRESVYEIIWDENEASSSPSSLPSVSPTRKGSLLESTNSNLDRGPYEGELAGTELNAWPTALFRQATSTETNQSVLQNAILRLRQSYGNIFKWSWDERHLEAAYLYSQSIDSSTVIAHGKNPESEARRPSMSQTSRIQSFPPLRPRRHTSEWRKAPLPDLNEPATSRAPHELLELKHPNGFGSLKDRGLGMYSSIPNAVSASVVPDYNAGSFRKMVDMYFKFPQSENVSGRCDGNAGSGPKRSKSLTIPHLHQQ